MFCMAAALSCLGYCFLVAVLFWEMLAAAGWVVFDSQETTDSFLVRLYEATNSTRREMDPIFLEQFWSDLRLCWEFDDILAKLSSEFISFVLVEFRGFGSTQLSRKGLPDQNTCTRKLSLTFVDKPVHLIYRILHR